MREIEDGEFFPLNTDNRRNAMKYIVQKLRTGPKDKGRLVSALLEEEVYSQKQDCKDFIRNCINSENHEIVENGRREIALTGTSKVRKSA